MATTFRIGQKVYIIEHRMPQYGRRVTIRGTADSRSLGMFFECRDEQGNRLLLRVEEIAVSKPQSMRHG
ncbi:MAG: hypothetical protein NHB32_24985 [Fischerella sp. CENA71]|nr:hypothetical protein [Fischerella sp. CENA71]